MFALLGLGFLVLSTPNAWAELTEPLKVSPEELTTYQRAAAYSRAHRGLSMVVIKDGQVVFEDYADGHSANEAHNLYSGTKSFSCAIAVAAVEDKLLNLDEPVSQTITEWQADAQKSEITIRQLLTLTSGIETGPPNGLSLSALFSQALSYADSINTPMRHEPGTTFQYGAIPFQIFGEIMRRKLASSSETPRGYLERRILNPIGLKVDSWRTTADGNPKLYAGASLAAREWAKYGQLILNEGRWGDKQILNKGLLSECFNGTAANPGYGLTFWLPVKGGTNSEGKSADRAAARLRAGGAPDVVIKAAGVSGQKLYVIPSWNLIVVRQASRLPLWGWGFDDVGFLAPIFKQSAPNKTLQPTSLSPLRVARAASELGR